MYKTKLQELCHQFSWNLPEYAIEKDGPDHNPRFTATVIVNGVSFESPKDQCRSSKEAQNHAAHIAYDHFTVPQSTRFSPHKLPSPPVLPNSSSFPGALTSESKVDVRPPNMDIFQQRQNNIRQLSHVNGAPLAGVNTNTSKGMLHLYKNRLQHYAQKQNLTLPVYSSVLDGPSHARRFRSKVTVDGKTYETQEFFSTLKEAEHAAAKVAFESLALNDIQEDEGLYKTLLQELAQKEGLLFPVYDTARTGPPHAPIFCSMVEVGGGTFQGQEAKTKKQAEMNAAKVAYNALVKHGQLDEPLKVLPANSGCAAADVPQLVVQPKTKLIIEELNLQNEDSQLEEPLKVLPSSSGCAATDDLQLLVQQKTRAIIEKLNLHNEEAETNAKRHKCLTSLNTVPLIRDRYYAAPSSASPVSDHSTDSDAESEDSGSYPGTSIMPSEKTIVFPRNSNMELPDGAVVLPCSDENWVAVRLV